MKDYILRMKDYLISENFWVNDDKDISLFTMPQLYPDISNSFHEFEKLNNDREIYVFRLDFWIHKAI